MFQIVKFEMSSYFLLHGLQVSIFTATRIYLPYLEAGNLRGDFQLIKFGAMRRVTSLIFSKIPPPPLLPSCTLFSSYIGASFCYLLLFISILVIFNYKKYQLPALPELPLTFLRALTHCWLLLRNDNY